MNVKVKRANIVLTQADRVNVFLALQKQEIFMIKGYNTKNSALFNSEVLVKTEKVIKILSSHQKKKPLFATISVSDEAFNATSDQEVQLIDKVINLENQIADKEEQIKRLEDANKSYQPFVFLSVAQEKLENSEVVDFKAFKLKSVKETYITDALKAIGVEFEYGLVETNLFLVVPFFPAVAQDIQIALSGAEAEEIKLPQTPLVYAVALEQNVIQIEGLKKELELLNSLIDEEVKHLDLVKTYYDKEANRIIRDYIPHKSTENFIVLEGFVREDQLSKLQKLLNDVAPYAEVEIVEDPQEVLPTALNNNKFVKPFESVTNSFSVPSNQEVDPNPAMSIWYWLFFGIMFADIAYGLILLVGTILMLKLMKPKGGFKQMLQVFMYSSISTIIFGFVTGSVFGVDLVSIFPGLPNIFISAVKDPMIVLIGSLVLGAFHLITALVFKTIRMVKEKDILGALAESVSWILILFFGMVYIADMMNILWTSNAVVSYGSLGLILLGAVFIVFLSGRGSKNLLGWAAKGFGGIYGATSYLSDILSYSRLLALMLSGAVIGSTMNLLAGMVSGAFFGLGIIFSIVILIIGHLFNFAMSLLSAYVHGGRLQYLEFFGKFYEGGGIAFEPLAYQLHYINEIKEN